MTSPKLTGFSPSIIFAEDLVNAGPQLLETDCVLTAGTSGFGNSRLTISGLLPEDIISVRNEGTGLGQVGVSGTTITYSGIAIGTISGGNGSPLTIQFGLFAGTTSVEAVIRNLTYANLSNTPTLSRTLLFDITDAGGGRLNGAPMSFSQLTGAANPFSSFVVQWESAPTAVDLDGDGDLDLVVGERFGTLRVLQNDGAAGFTDLFYTPNPFTNIDFGTNSTPSFGDLDKDGDLDLVIGSLYDSVRSYLNNGAGGYVELVGAANPFASMGSGSAPSFGDLDQDGDRDVVFGAADGTLRSFRNNGNGTFTELTGAANPFNGVDVGRESAPTFVDIDGDVDMDAVVGAEDGTLHVFVNNGAGVFTELTGASNPFDGVDVGLLASPTFLDVNGDGALDAVVGAYDGTLRTFLGKPFLTFDVIVPADSNAPRLSGLAPTAIFSENLVNQTPQVLDVDVVFTDDDGNLNGGTLTLSGLLAQDRVSVLNQGVAAGQIGLSGASVTFGGVEIGTLAGGVGTTLTIVFNAAATQAAIDALIQNLTYANVSNTPVANRTLVLDVTDAQGQHLNAVPATFSALTGAEDPFGGIRSVLNYSVPSFVDLDGDGDMDAVVGGESGYLQSFANDGTGRFTELFGASNPLYSVIGNFHSSVAFGDLDGDQDMDAVVGDGLGSLRTFASDGAGGFSELAGAANPFDGLDVGFSSTPSLVDLDGDGDMDLVVGERYGTVRSFANNGTGLFAELTGAANPFNGIDFGLFNRPSFVDLDRDGDMDLVTGQENGTLRYFENDGSGRFFEQVQGNNPFIGIDVGDRSAPSFVDLDGDGDMDLVVGKDDGTLLSYENTTVAGATAVRIKVTVVNELDTFTGDSGDDSLVGTVDADVLLGLDGNDTLNGLGGADTLEGGAGDDWYTIDNAGDTVVEVSGGGVLDRILASVSYTLAAGDDIERLTTTNAAATTTINLTGNALAQTITGNAGSNQLNGGGGADTLNGGLGDDTLNGGLGNDTLLGGAGNDTYAVDTAGDRVFETTTTASAIDAGGIDTVKSAVTFSLDSSAGVRFVERLTLTGSASINGTGNALANLLTGNSGNNAMNGGLGNDTLLGGAGNDTFVFNSTPGAGNVDRIQDFNVADDMIRLDDSIYSGLAKGLVSASAFTANMTGQAGTASDRIIYETDTGRLYFDVDGVGGTARIHFATLAPGLAVTNSDFFVF